jgi:hypothetical protein
LKNLGNKKTAEKSLMPAGHDDSPPIFQMLLNLFGSFQSHTERPGVELQNVENDCRKKSV